MPNLASAAKRMKQNERNRASNRARKSVLKSETKKFLDLVAAGKGDAAKTALAQVYKKVDQIAAKGSLHKNTAARRKSRLAKQLNAAATAPKATKKG